MNKTVLIVDDSLVFRKSFEKIINQLENIEIIGSVWNGELVRPFLTRENKPYLITLDVEMPLLNGIETLKEIQAFNDTLPNEEKIYVIMVSSKTVNGGEITIQALERGAIDYILKPSGTDVEQNKIYLKKEFLRKLSLIETLTRKLASPKNNPTILIDPSVKRFQRTYKIITIGISTGGPKTLFDFLPQLSQITDLPILVAQHISEGFTASLANHLNKRCNHKVTEAYDGQKIESNNIYLAPGGLNMILKQDQNNRALISINDNFSQSEYRPSINHLFRSAAAIYKEQLISIIMTGMGNDGTAALSTIKRKNGLTIAQDEESSIVWGMPRRAIESGFIDTILPTKDIPNYINEVCI